jgi:hypothetical protein
VYDLCAAGDLPGEGIELGSGVMDETVRWPGCCLEGGCKDFALALRAAVGSLGTPVVGAVLMFADSVSRLFPLFSDGARPSWGIALSLALSARKRGIIRRRRWNTGTKVQAGYVVDLLC